MFSAVQEVVQSHNGPLSNGQSLLRLFTTSAAHVEQGKAFPPAPRATTSAQTPRVPTVNLVSGAVCHAARHSPACRPHLTSTLGSFSMIFLKICALSLCSQSLYVARRFLESGSARTLALRDEARSQAPPAGWLHGRASLGMFVLSRILYKGRGFALTARGGWA